MDSHVKNNCFKLNSYSGWLKIKNKIGRQLAKQTRSTTHKLASYESTTVDGSICEEDDPLNFPNTNSKLEELNATLSSLHQEVSKLMKGKTTLRITIRPSTAYSGYATDLEQTDFSGNLHVPKAFHVNISNVDPWIIDSGAIDHICLYKSLFAFLNAL